MKMSNRFLFAILTIILVVASSRSTTISNSPPIKHLKLDHGLRLNVSIGTPPQNLSLILNTVTSGTWVRRVPGRSGGNETEQSAVDLEAHRTGWTNCYQAELSASSKNLKEVHEQKTELGKCWLQSFEDQMRSNGIDLGLQLFKVLKTVVVPSRTGVVSFAHFDGMLGLGDRNHVLHLDLVRTLQKQGLIAERMFSLHLDQRDPREQQQQYNGTLIVGGVDEQYFRGPLVWAPSRRRWQFHPDYVQLERRRTSTNMTTIGYPAIIDSTSNIIVGPQRWIKILYEALDLVPNSEYGMYPFSSCDRAYSSGIRLTIAINGTRHELEARDLVIKLWWRAEETCFLALAGHQKHYPKESELNHHWILGTPFLKKFYTVYDYDRWRMGFALATSGV